MVSMLHETVRVRGIKGNIVPVDLLIFDHAIFHVDLSCLLKGEPCLPVRSLSRVTE
jgi:hypothetical protein